MERLIKYCKELHSNYAAVLSGFEKKYPKADKDLLRQIDNYSRACALYLWKTMDTPV